MDRKIALKWARALEGGEYRQTHGVLRSHEGFCCLGVLCNLHAQAHPEIAAAQTDPDEYLDQTTNLPLAVMGWAGVDSASGLFTDGFILKFKNPQYPNEDEEARCLIDLNDDHMFDFRRIAKVIRKHSEQL